ncbi:hypothetical protein F5H01DRAFT_180201 [Linnemannia elongata]|nr:hypothetical protein F5H01DRAFT_180201 [Linnemannia elongata]
MRSQHNTTDTPAPTPCPALASLPCLCLFSLFFVVVVSSQQSSFLSFTFPSLFSLSLPSIPLSFPLRKALSFTLLILFYYFQATVHDNGTSSFAPSLP